MNFNFLCIAFIAVIAILFLVFTVAKSPHPFLKAVSSSISGIFGLAVIILLQNHTGITIPLNLLSLSVSSLLGIPGVGTLMILNTLFL